ncbi:DNA polymerase delta subunit 3-like [Epargyreus clarus]|uniref:DNA polymerase delta subunit 3-like n=1 Tax=Epargyreus clarus TaxID=520877 RepID=UPI003C30CC37
MEDIFEANKSMLKSMLLDEEKLITYVSLSKDLCIHVNNSKLLLKRIVNSVRQDRPDLQLNVTYILSGATDSNNAKTIVCPEEDLGKQKESFKNIFFEHIYSVNMGRPRVDTAAYLTVNKFDDFVLCSGLIKSSQCDKRTSVEIGNLKSSSHEITVPEKSKSLPASSKIKQESDTKKNNYTEIKPVSKDKESKSEPIIKKEVVSPKKETSGNNKPKLSSTNGHKTQKGIAGFFSKPNNSTKKEVKPVIQNGNDAKVKVEKNNSKVEEMETEPSNMLPINDKLKKDDNANKILNEIKKSSKVDKKRKRVLHVSDSDSDHENNDPFVDDSNTEQVITHESDDEIPPTPTTNSIKITSGIVNPKKRRKVVDKTYTDEEGYILTKKVEVYESCSENEEDIKEVKEKLQPKIVKTETSPKEKSSGNKKKVSPPQKGKQPTLTNFFKKV